MPIFDIVRIKRLSYTPIVGFQPVEFFPGLLNLLRRESFDLPSHCYRTFGIPQSIILTGITRKQSDLGKLGSHFKTVGQIPSYVDGWELKRH